MTWLLSYDGGTFLIAVLFAVLSVAWVIRRIRAPRIERLPPCGCKSCRGIRPTTKEHA